jgi:hypothetical protein
VIKLRKKCASSCHVIPNGVVCREESAVIGGVPFGGKKQIPPLRVRNDKKSEQIPALRVRNDEKSEQIPPLRVRNDKVSRCVGRFDSLLGTV